MFVIGLAGRAGTGKDTIGDILREEYGFKTISFARPIKEAVAYLLGAPYEAWDDREWRETPVPVWGRTPRYMAQTLGTEWGRRCIKRDLWRDLAFAAVRKLIDEEPDLAGVAITDVRFENEAHGVRHFANGHVLHVRRPEGINLISNTEHASEAGLPPQEGEILINNEGTIDDLANKVHEALAHYRAVQLEEMEQAADAARAEFDAEQARILEEMEANADEEAQANA